MARTKIASWSEIDNYRQCPFKHQNGYIERWKSPTTGPALSRGTLWHTVLEHHYKALAFWQRLDLGNPGAKAQEELYNEIKQLYLQSDDGTQTDDQELIEWMYSGYTDHFWREDFRWRIVAVEHAPVLWLPTDRGTRSSFKLKAKIDVIARDIASRDAQLWVWDHKSGKDLPKDKELELDDQFGLYTWMMRQMGTPIFGCIHNAARTQRNKDQEKHFQPLDERFRRKPMYRTDVELDQIAREAYLTLRKAYAPRDGDAERNTNPDTCRWRCDYTEACLASRKGMDRKQFLEAQGFVQDWTRH